jgi:hypothetical protein
MSESVPSILHSMLPFISDTAWNLILYEVLVPMISTTIGLGFAKLFGWKPTKGQVIGFSFLFFCAALLAIFVLKSIPLSRSDSSSTVPGPDFTGMIESVGQLKSGDDTIVTATVDIENRGTPSVVWQWDMEITLLSGQRIEPKRTQPPPLPISSAANVSIVMVSGSASIKLHSSTFLPHTLGEIPLETGAAKEGWVEFDFGHVQGDELLRPGTIYTLKLIDGRGKIYPVETTLQPNE